MSHETTFNFSEAQKRVILQASETLNRAADVFIALSDATTLEDKLDRLESYHALLLEEIDLLRQVGDPDTERKLAHEQRNYEKLKAEYDSKFSAPPPESTPARAFQAARLAVLHEHQRGIDQRAQHHQRQAEAHAARDYHARLARIDTAHAAFGPGAETDGERPPLPEYNSIPAIVEQFAAWLRSHGGRVPSEGIGAPIDDLLLIHRALVHYLSDDPCAVEQNG
jgi:hypothetical protein